MAFDPHVNGFTNVIEAFHETHPNITVNLEPQPGQAEMVSKMRSALSAGRGAHGFTTPGTTITEWVPNGFKALSPMRESPSCGTPSTPSNADGRNFISPRWTMCSNKWMSLTRS